MIKNQFKKHPLIYTGALCFLIGLPLGISIELDEKTGFTFFVYAFSLLLVLVPYILFPAWLFVLAPINFFRDQRSFLQKKFLFIGWIMVATTLMVCLYLFEVLQEHMRL